MYVLVHCRLQVVAGYVSVSGVRIFSGAGLDVQWSGCSYLGVEWSGHVRRGFGGADDVAKRLIG